MSQAEMENLDDIVDIICRRVAEKLTQKGLLTGPLPNLPGGGSGGCEECIGCGHCASRRPEAVKNLVASGAERIGAQTGIRGAGIDAKMAAMIDHTLLKPDATREQLMQICDEARQYSFATVCVNSANIPLVSRQLRGSAVKPIAVVGFPLGAATSQAKAFEAREAIQAGAEEIDMVINIGALKSKDYKTVFEDIRTVVEAARPHKLKVILETAQLNQEEKVIACSLAKTAGAAFVKTSTGFGGGGATVEDIALMRRIVGSDMEVKASGGIRTRADAQKMIQAGADRIGASASVAIVTGRDEKKGTY